MSILTVQHLEKHFENTKVLNDISFSLEEGQAVSEARVKTRAKPREESEQLYFIDEKAETIKKRLRQADPNTLTPIEALNFLYELKKTLKGSLNR